MASSSEQYDDVYFASTKGGPVANIQGAVPNNNPQNFVSYQRQENYNTLQEENFSARNVNPEYIARYQQQNQGSNDTSRDAYSSQSNDAYYYDETQGQQQQYNTTADGQQDINVYNNFYGYNNPTGPVFNNFNTFNTFGRFNRFNRFGWGGFYDPWGFRPGFNTGWNVGWNSWTGFNVGFGFGTGFGSPWGWGNGFYDPFWGGPIGGGFYDPFWGPTYAWGNPYGGFWGNPWGSPFWGRPNVIIVNPGVERPTRDIVRGSRMGRSTVPNVSTANNANVTPGRPNRVAYTNTNTDSRDFSKSQNEYYNRSRATGSVSNYNGQTRSAAAMRSGAVSSPATTNSRTYSPTNSPAVRNAAPARTTGSRVSPAATGRRGATYIPNSRTTSPTRSAYSRPTAPTRNTYSAPRTNTNSRSTYTPPSRSNSNSRSTYTPPSRSNYSPPARTGGSTGGGSRGGSVSSGGGSRRGGN
ncbi:hypothetical protein [Penaeicola halotolerans]|uniref:hypothetical protein n=1 Tax=Penaeicola halotolerans TaxID=2793196 RepID=UPI001CF893EA|nr:hypothetical protein [Penaeicola halotolerans]